MRVVLLLLCMLFATAGAEDETAHLYGPESKRPPRKRIANALAKHLHKHAIAKRLLTPESCKVMRASEQAIVMHCYKRGCGDNCMVLEASAELRFRPKGVTSVHKISEKHVGETGQCGHCLSTE